MTQNAAYQRFVPDFEARTSQGMLELTDFTSKRKWGTLFSHPADFTPACTTEFVEFSKRQPGAKVIVPTPATLPMPRNVSQPVTSSK